MIEVEKNIPPAKLFTPFHTVLFYDSIVLIACNMTRIILLTNE